MIKIWNKSSAKMAAVIAAVLLGTTGNITQAKAMNGNWVQDGTGWFYQYEDGSIQGEGWSMVNGSWYHFDKNQYMSTGWMEEDGRWFYLNSQGMMQQGWAFLDGGWYFLAADGAMVTGWMEENAAWYHMDPNGVMQLGWQEIDGSWYYFTSAGTMAADMWVDDLYLDPSGVWIPDMVPPAVEEPEEPVPPVEEPTEPSQPEQTPPFNTTDSDAVIQQRLVELQTKYPSGQYWNHVGYGMKPSNYNTYSETVTNYPCIDHDRSRDSIGLYCNSYFNPALGNFIGYQCDGFARKLSDELFGMDAPVRFYEYNFDALSVGDYLRYVSSDNIKQHTVFIISKTADAITVAEANIGGSCMIRWGREIRREDLNELVAEGYTITCFSRR